MAERRPPGFNVPLNFYDGPEVDSIPRRIRAAAIGVWTLCGNYAATQLTDGYVPAGMLKSFGCTDAIRAAMKVTINKKGELSPLWEEARNGGIQLTNWPKHQRTNDDVTTYRASEAERKRLEREAKRNGSTTANAKTSGRTSGGQAKDVRPDDRDPETKTETETKTDLGPATDESAPNVGDFRADDDRALTAGLSAPVSRSASRLVAEIVGSANDGYAPAVLSSLRIHASQIAHDHGTEVAAESLRIWKTKPHLGANALPNLTAEATKAIHSRNHPATGRLSAGEAKVVGWAALGQPQTVPDDRKAIER